MQNWFQCYISCEEVAENGFTKTVVNQHLVDALSFTEAESISLKIEEKCQVVDIKRTRYCEVIESEDANDDKFFTAKVDFVELDEKTNKEKKTSVFYCVQASNIEVARKRVVEYMSSGLGNYTISVLRETKLVAVHKYVKPVNGDNL